MKHLIPAYGWTEKKELITLLKQDFNELLERDDASWDETCNDWN